MTLHANCPGDDVYSLEEEWVLTVMMKEVVMRGKRNRVPACRLFSGFDDNDDVNCEGRGEGC